MADKAFTLPECPNCLAQHEAIAKWKHPEDANPSSQAVWHCFACESDGYLLIEYHVTKDPQWKANTPES